MAGCAQQLRATPAPWPGTAGRAGLGAGGRLRRGWGATAGTREALGAFMSWCRLRWVCSRVRGGLAMGTAVVETYLIAQFYLHLHYIFMRSRFIMNKSINLLEPSLLGVLITCCVMCIMLTLMICKLQHVDAAYVLSLSQFQFQLKELYYITTVLYD